jgi:hypothetical protein
MARLQVDAFEKNDAEAAAELLAARHRAARAKQPFLPQRFEDTGAWHEGLIEAAPAGTGLVARQGGRLVGFMLGREDLPDQRSMGARWGDPRAGFVPLDGHATAADRCRSRIPRAV